jgi:hypothetical protein
VGAEVVWLLVPLFVTPMMVVLALLIGRRLLDLL